MNNAAARGDNIGFDTDVYEIAINIDEIACNVEKVVANAAQVSSNIVETRSDNSVAYSNVMDLLCDGLTADSNMSASWRDGHNFRFKVIEASCDGRVPRSDVADIHINVPKVGSGKPHPSFDAAKALTNTQGDESNTRIIHISKGCSYKSAAHPSHDAGWGACTFLSLTSPTRSRGRDQVFLEVR